MSHAHLLDDSYAVTTAHSRQATLRVFTRGSGPAVVLLPGNGRPPADLHALAVLLDQAGYRVVLPEPRGMGASTGPLAGVTLHDLAGDVAAAITAGHGAGPGDSDKPALVVGHAFGNRVARTLAADRPDLVDTVALLSCSGKVPRTADIEKADHVAMDPSTPAAARRTAAAQAWFGPGADPTPLLGGWNLAVREAYAAAARATPMAEWWTAGRARVLIVQGLEDYSAPTANGRLLKEELGERATLVELPGVGHTLPVEAPVEVAEVLLRYLSEAPGS